MDAENKDKGTRTGTLLEAWMKSAFDFWGTMMPTENPVNAQHPPGGQQTSEFSRTQETLEALFKSWRTFSTVMEEPETMASALKGMNAMPEIMLKMVQTTWHGFFSMQQQWMEKASRVGESTQAYQFDGLDQDIFRLWTEIYEKEFRQFLKIPPIGLTREYQERMNTALDAFNRFQAAMSEFLSILSVPMEKSIKVMQDELAQMADDGKLPEGTKDYYKLWIKILEGHFMTLYKSPEYNDTLAKTLDAMGGYITARQKLYQDMLHHLPIPTYKEMDELYKELYLLKKRVKYLERNRNGAPAPEHHKTIA